MAEDSTSISFILSVCKFRRKLNRQSLRYRSGTLTIFNLIKDVFDYYRVDPRLASRLWDFIKMT